MDTLARVKNILRDTLNLGDRAAMLTPDSPLLGGLPEFDSMAVVTVVTMIEDELGVDVEVETHIEPLEIRELEGRPADAQTATGCFH